MKGVWQSRVYITCVVLFNAPTVLCGLLLQSYTFQESQSYLREAWSALRPGEHLRTNGQGIACAICSLLGSTELLAPIEAPAGIHVK